MKFYISTTGIKRVTISTTNSSAKGSTVATRRVTRRAVFPVVLLLSIVLPFLFVRIAFLVLESASACNSALDCIGWRLLGGSETSLLREELTRALVEAREGHGTNDGDYRREGSTESFNVLVNEMTTNQQDIKTFAFRTKAMQIAIYRRQDWACNGTTNASASWQLSMMELKVQSAREQESINWHFASHGVPKSLHCLCLKLAEEYAVNAMARSHLPPPEYVSRLTDPSFHHVVLLTDNVLAASVVISSTVQHSANPEKLVFHIVTDKKTYIPMNAWFAINPIKSAAVEVKGLHQYDWSHEVNVRVKEMLEIHRLIWSHYNDNLRNSNFQHEGAHERSLEALTPSCLSLLNHLRIYIPELFPDLNKIVFLDEDVVVQHDTSSLWELDLNKKVVGAVVDSWCGDNCCPGKKYKDYLNFSHPIISSNFDHDRCVWLYGVNVFDLEAWRRVKITTNYHKWLKQNLNFGMELWQPGAHPPALLAFEGQVHPIDPSWHVGGLGYRPPQAHNIKMLGDAAVLHFSGPAKPWLDIGFPELRSLWNRHVNFSDKFIRKCRILG